MQGEEIPLGIHRRNLSHIALLKGIKRHPLEGVALYIGLAGQARHAREVSFASVYAEANTFSKIFLTLRNQWPDETK